MKLKTTNKIALEQAIQHKDNKIELVGCSNLCKCDSLIENIVKQNNICDKKNTFVKIFGLNSKFYYKISHRKDFEYHSCEIGLGSLEKIDNKIYLKRLSPIVAVEKNEVINLDNCSYNFNCRCKNDGMLIISNYSPSDISQLLIDKNSIISTTNDGYISPTYIDNNSVIGRLDENITSIPLNVLFNKIIKYDVDERKVKFFTGSQWINLVEEIDEDTK